MHFRYAFLYVAIKYINSFKEIKLNELYIYIYIYIYNLAVKAEDGIASTLSL